MSERPPDAVRVAVEVAQIAAAPGRIEERAEALVEPLRRLVPFRGAWISLLDPERREQPPLVSHGYPDSLVRYMGGPAGVAEIELLGLSRSRGATRLSDLPVPLGEVRSWAEYLAPAGFRGGLAAALFTPDGRYLGMLGLNTDTTAHPTEAACDLIGALASTIAQAVDPMRTIAAATRIVRDAQAAIVLTRAGDALPLPGLPGHPLLATGSTVLALAAQQLAAGNGHGSFLAPDTRPDTTGSHLRVTVLDCPKQPPGHLSGVVVVSPPRNLRGLSSLELRILGMLIERWPDQRIAAALTILHTAVTGHIEDILAKLDAPTRDLAIVRAARHGLHVPPTVR
jgi:DNA-binding CsgD family transcriptional regulator